MHKDKLYIYGGNVGGTPSNETWEFSLSNFKWKQIKCNTHQEMIPEPRAGHCSVLIGDLLYLFGGKDEDNKKLNDLWQFNITMKSWKKIRAWGTFPQCRSGCTMNYYNHKLFLFGGIFEITQELNDLYIFDLKTVTWIKAFENKSGENESPTKISAMPRKSLNQS